ncbi:hypothetical protein CHARACLAT_027705 [Characodon lateralis]|uniref:Uncharacterized protein n=1 Tax=Characodon lateralis TaxID=208331 RepID=A0ABU7EMS4_9TELE|nr:hypothetical protein [Characodon lateralis]
MRHCSLKIVQHEKLNVPFRSAHTIAKRKTLQRLRIALQEIEGSGLFVDYIEGFMKSASSGSVTDPRDGKRVALKKMPNVFQNLVSCKRVFRELKMLCFFKHENVLSALDILQPPHINCFEEMYPLPC